MNGEEIREKLDNYSALLPKIIFLGGAIDWPGGRFGDDLTEALEWQPEDILSQIGVPERLWERGDAEIVDWMAMHRKSGFLAHVMYPEHRYFKGGGAEVSMGIWQTTFCYAETVDAAVGKCLEWLEKKDQEARAQAA